MNLNSLLIEQGLKRLDIPESSRKQFMIASLLSDVGGKGFPKELFSLSAPVITRGLLNFALIQMYRDWIYPFWVHRQLNPKSDSFIARSQNPLLINVTHRNWTAIGSPYGSNEAIIDPRGLATPLPREWSVDTWVSMNGDVLFPSLTDSCKQTMNTDAPTITTKFSWNGINLTLENFVGVINGSKDILFGKASIQNCFPIEQSGYLFLAVRPFNPEGIAPIESSSIASSRFVEVNRSIGLVLAEEPKAVLFANTEEGDCANVIRRLTGRWEHDLDILNSHSRIKIESSHGMASCALLYPFKIKQHEKKDVFWSIALASDEALRTTRRKQTWRVSYPKRFEEHSRAWRKEIQSSAEFPITNKHLKKLFEASRNTLLMLCDREFISPGPYLYHRFWFRDAAPMCSALGVLGYHKRVRDVLNSFDDYLTSDGFFKAPDGEWDSNGTVLWSMLQHYKFTNSDTWLKHWYPKLITAGMWITRMRKKTRDTSTTHRGLMPKSLSAEHLGTVDQYYWDSLWSLAGLEALTEISSITGKKDDAIHFKDEGENFRKDIIRSFELVEQKTGSPLIPSAPSRVFDETAIGTLASVYPLALFGKETNIVRESLDEFIRRYVDEKGLYHPFIHSGYNPYLTFQIAHALLWSENHEEAWKIANTIFNQATEPYSLPEAIHPRTGGGSMGDGHHGWAAAEIILFIRDCFVRETYNDLVLFSGLNKELFDFSIPLEFNKVPTLFGTVSCSFIPESEHRWEISIDSTFTDKKLPEAIEIHIPMEIEKIIPVNPANIIGTEKTASGSILRLQAITKKIFLEGMLMVESKK